MSFVKCIRMCDGRSTRGTTCSFLPYWICCNQLQPSVVYSVGLCGLETRVGASALFLPTHGMPHAYYLCNVLTPDASENKFSPPSNRTVVLSPSASGPFKVPAGDYRPAQLSPAQRPPAPQTHTHHDSHYSPCLRCL